MVQTQRDNQSNILERTPSKSQLLIDNTQQLDALQSDSTKHAHSKSNSKGLLRNESVSQTKTNMGACNEENFLDTIEESAKSHNSLEDVDDPNDQDMDEDSSESEDEEDDEERLQAERAAAAVH